MYVQTNWHGDFKVINILQDLNIMPSIPLIVISEYSKYDPYHDKKVVKCFQPQETYKPDDLNFIYR